MRANDSAISETRRFIFARHRACAQSNSKYPISRSSSLYVNVHRCRGTPKMDTAGRCAPIRIALHSRGIGRRKRIDSRRIERFAGDGRPDSLLADYSDQPGHLPDSFPLSRFNRCLPKIAVLFGEESSSTGSTTRRAVRVAKRTGYFLGSNLLPTIDPRRSIVVARRANRSVLVIRNSPAGPPLIAGSSKYAGRRRNIETQVKKDTWWQRYKIKEKRNK